LPQIVAETFLKAFLSHFVRILLRWHVLLVKHKLIKRFTCLKNSENFAWAQTQLC